MELRGIDPDFAAALEQNAWTIAALPADRREALRVAALCAIAAALNSQNPDEEPDTLLGVLDRHGLLSDD